MEKSETGHMYWVMIVAMFLIIVASAVVLVNVNKIQNDPDIEVSERNDVHDKSMQITKRGDILDRNGRVLACSVPEYTTYFDPRVEYLQKNPHLVSENIDAIAEGLANIFKEPNHDKSYYLKKLKDAVANKKMCKLHGKNVDYNTAKKMSALPLFCNGPYKGGFSVQTMNNRVYPYGGIARRALGSVHEEEKDKSERGTTGIEKFYDDVLNGNEHSLQYLGNEPESGTEQYNIVSTLDADIQAVVHDELTKTLQRYEAEWGCAVVMEVQTGEIIAMSNLSHNDNPEDSCFYENYNFAAARCCDPGSTVKLPSLMVALEDGVIKLDDTINTGSGTVQYGALTVTDWKEGGLGKLSVREVFAQSSNVGVSKIINKYYAEKDNAWDYIQRIKQMKLGEQCGVDLQNEPKPTIKDPSMKDWRTITLLQMSYGYEIELTPLQMLTFYNAVANNGKWVKPHLVREILWGDKCVKRFTPQENGTICSQSTLKKAHKLLESVVEIGTAKKFNSKYYKIAGKTGTAQTFEKGGYNKKKWRGSFCGYFPAENPKYSCIVVIQSKEGGQYNAVGVFRRVADRIFFMDNDLRNSMPEDTASVAYVPRVSNGYTNDYKSIVESINLNGDFSSTDWSVNEVNKNTLVSKPITYKEGIMPNFVGMGMRDVTYLADSLHIRVHCTGFGRLNRQSIHAGTPYKPDDLVVLEFGNGR